MEKNWYKLEKFRPPGPRRPGRAHDPNKTHRAAAVLTRVRAKTYALAKKQYLRTFGYFCTRAPQPSSSRPVLIPLFRAPDMARWISRTYPSHIARFLTNPVLYRSVWEDFTIGLPAISEYLTKFRSTSLDLYLADIYIPACRSGIILVLVWIFYSWLFLD